MSEKKAHSVKVPKTFKLAAKIYKEVVAGGNLKSLVYNQRFYNIKVLYALVVETLRHAKVLDYIIQKSEILRKEERLDPSLARILISELLWGKRQLPGNSRPIQTVISYKDKLIKAQQCHEELLSKEQESRKGNFFIICNFFSFISDLIKFNMEDKETTEGEGVSFSPPVDNTSFADSARVLASFVIYSLAMFTLPFIAYTGTKYTLRTQFHIDGFQNVVWSVLAAVIVTNIIIIMYACKGYSEVEEDESKAAASRSDLDEKKKD